MRNFGTFDQLIKITVTNNRVVVVVFPRTTRQRLILLCRILYETKMRTNLSLPQMVDLALGTPEVGAVNFNVLHTLLHALIQKLDLTESRAVISEEDREFLARKQYEYEQSTDAATEDGAKSVTDSGIDGSTVSATLKPSAPIINSSPYHQLEEKVGKLERELELLNALPSNSELLDKMRYRGDGERIRPMSDMWQTMQITKKVDANEEGIGKVSQLF